MTIGTLKSPNPRNLTSISVITSKFLSVFSMNTKLAILKITDARRDVILAGVLYHRFPWRHLPPSLDRDVKRHSFNLFLFTPKTNALTHSPPPPNATQPFLINLIYLPSKLSLCIVVHPST